MKKRVVWALRILSGCCIILFLIYSPPLLKSALLGNAYDKWFVSQREEHPAVVSVWHIVDFKPCVGSLGQFVLSRAAAVEKRRGGIFFDVLALDAAEASSRLAKGQQPDMYSFPIGFMDSEGLLELDMEMPKYKGNLSTVGLGENGGLFALPYAFSAHALLATQDVTLPKGGITAKWLNEAAKKAKLAGDAINAAMLGYKGELLDYAAFLDKKAALALADIRASRDMERRLEAGKGFIVQTAPLGDYTSLVQLIGINKSIDKNKLKYALELIAAMLEEKSQLQLVKLGALTAIELSCVPEYSILYAKKADIVLASPKAPNAFLYKQFKQELLDGAARGIAGDSQGLEGLNRRLLELVHSA